MDDINIPELVADLNSPDDGIRKKAAFRLQSTIGDPSFADQFEIAGGLTALRSLALNATGNTLAYSLASFSKLLEVLDQGWEYVDRRLIERLVELVVSHPLVNILRGAVSILAAVVAKPSSDASESPNGLPGGQQDRTLGFGALKPILIHHPTFLEMLVTRLSSADHALCANALQLINALMKDAITNSTNQATSTTSGSSGEEWPLFIKRLQDLGVIKAVYNLMQSNGIQDLAHPLYDFQALTKILLRKWRTIPVNIETKDHRRGLKAVHLASLSESERAARISQQTANGTNKLKPPLEINRWRNLGFDTEHPTSEFAVFGVGYLGLMDLMDFARQSPDGFHKLLLEKSFLPQNSRCPVAKASLAVTAILYDHFEVEPNVINGLKSDDNDDELFDQQRYAALESRSNLDGVFRPLLLQWSRLHTASLLAFVRLWDETGAQADEDFPKIEELVRILVEHVVGLAGRTDDVLEVERKMQEYKLKELRVLQMELLELTHEDHWGVHLKQIKDELHYEATQFMREQRIRCLLAGAWFPNHAVSSTYTNSLHPLNGNPPDVEDKSIRISQEYLANTTAHTNAMKRLSAESNAAPAATGMSSAAQPWRYAILSHNRRQLHYADFSTQSSSPPPLETLEHKIELAQVSKIDHTSAGLDTTGRESFNTPYNVQPRSQHTITLLGNPNPQPPQSPRKSRQTPLSTPVAIETPNPLNSTAVSKVVPILTLHPETSSLYSEWLYGLSVLVTSSSSTHSQKISHRSARTRDALLDGPAVKIGEPQTERIIDFLTRYGGKLRMLNVSWEYEGVLNVAGNVGDALAVGKRGSIGALDRRGLDEEFYYDVGGASATAT